MNPQNGLHRNRGTTVFEGHDRTHPRRICSILCIRRAQRPPFSVLPRLVVLLLSSDPPLSASADLAPPDHFTPQQPHVLTTTSTVPPSHRDSDQITVNCLLQNLCYGYDLAKKVSPVSRLGACVRRTTKIAIRA